MRNTLRSKFSTPTSTSLYSGINTLYAQNPVFEIVHESVKVYPHMYNGNVQQNPLCVESCVTKKFSMSPRFPSTIFDPDANSVLLRAGLYAQKTLCSKLLGVSKTVHIDQSEYHFGISLYPIGVDNLIHPSPN